MKQREFVYLVCNFYSPGPPAAARVNDYLGVCLFSLFSHFYLVFLGIQKHNIFFFFFFWFYLYQICQLNLYTMIFLLCSVLYVGQLLHICPSWESDISYVAPPEVSSIFFFLPLLKVSLSLSLSLSNPFSAQQNINNDVAHCTDCKIHRGNVIMILGYIHKITRVRYKWVNVLYNNHHWYTVEI